MLCITEYFTVVYEHFIFKRTIQPLTVLRVFTKRTSKVVETFIPSWMWGAPKREVALLCAPIILYLFHWPEVSPPQTRGDRQIVVIYEKILESLTFVHKK